MSNKFQLLIKNILSIFITRFRRELRQDPRLAAAPDVLLLLLYLSASAPCIFSSLQAFLRSRVHHIPSAVLWTRRSCAEASPPSSRSAAARSSSPRRASRFLRPRGITRPFAYPWVVEYPLWVTRRQLLVYDIFFPVVSLLPSKAGYFGGTFISNSLPNPTKVVVGVE